jgi:citrate synthase
MEPWRTSIVDAGPAHIRVRGHDVLDLMKEATFTDLIFLLHHNRLPSIDERRLFDAMLIGVADHGAGAPSCAAARLAASGNRQSLSAAVAAGVLTIGDEHGGAGSAEQLGCLAAQSAGHDRGQRRHPLDQRRMLLLSVLSPAYSTEDPRGMCSSGLPSDRGWRATGAISRARSRTLSPSGSPIPLNIDGALAAIRGPGIPSWSGSSVHRRPGHSLARRILEVRAKPMRIYDSRDLRWCRRPRPSRE